MPKSKVSKLEEIKELLFNVALNWRLNNSLYPKPKPQQDEVIAQAILSWHSAEMEVEEKKRYWSPCPGCKDGHPSFWKTVVESPQWKLWQIEQSRRLHLLCEQKLPKDIATYDMPECEETGWISAGHFQEFIKFITGPTIQSAINKIKGEL